MKKHCYLSAIIILTMAATGWCSDKTIYSASTITVDGIMSYYSSMANLKNLNQLTMDKNTYNGMYNYIKKNRKKIIMKVAETKNFNNLGRAAQIINGLYKNQNTFHPYSKLQLNATAQGYFDSITGHRYYKTGANTYAEYTKKGAFLKTVPSDQPLLTKSRNIHPITKNNYILYQKTTQGKKDYLALPGYKKHPTGWKADKVLLSLK